MAHRQAELLTLQRTVLAPRLACDRLPSWAFLQKFAYLWSDLLALMLAHMLAVCLVQHFLRVPTSALNLFQYHRFYIPFFAVVLYLFEGYKSPELRRPERELELACKALALAFLGLILFNFVVFKSQPFSLYLLTCWFVLACPLLLVVRLALRAANVRLWKAGIGRRKTVLLGSAAGLAGYTQLLSTQRHHAYQLLGWIPGSLHAVPSSVETLRLSVLGPLDDWEEIIEQTGANLLVV